MDLDKLSDFIAKDSARFLTLAEQDTYMANLMRITPHKRKAYAGLVNGDNKCRVPRETSTKAMTSAARKELAGESHEGFTPDEFAVTIVAQNTECSHAQARRALAKCKGDVVQAIIDLTM